jgi:hypothetical protein
MAFGNVPNYPGTNTGNSRIVESDGSVFVKVYNDTGSALARGVVYALTYTVASGIAYADVCAPVADSTRGAIIGVVDNSPLGKDTIADAAYGYLRISGYCPYVVTSGVVAAGAQLEVLATAAAFIDQSTASAAVIGLNSAAIAIANVTTNVWTAFLFGLPVNIEAA